MPKITVIAHNIRSTHNIGAIFRSADGFGVEKIILSGYSPYPEIAADSRLPHIREKLSGQIHKTALGAEKLVPFEYAADIVALLVNRDRPLIALEQSTKSTSLKDYSPPDQFYLLIGEEVDGINSQLLEMCDDIIEIPMLGKKESFNVSVATGIALYALNS